MKVSRYAYALNFMIEDLQILLDGQIVVEEGFWALFTSNILNHKPTNSGFTMNEEVNEFDFEYLPFENVSKNTTLKRIMIRTVSLFSALVRNPYDAAIILPNKLRLNFNQSSKIYQWNGTTRKIRLFHLSSSLRFSGFIRLLRRIYEQILNEKPISKIGLVNNDKILLKNTTYLTQLLDDVSDFLQIPKEKLPVKRGKSYCESVIGNLYLGTNKTIKKIPNNFNKVIKLRTEADFILLYQSSDELREFFLSTDFYSKYNCLLIAVGRIPSRSLRFFLNKINKSKKLPICCLLDATIWGIENLRLFSAGSYKESLESSYLTVPAIKWIGVFPSELKIRLVNSKLNKMSERDKKKAEDLSGDEYVNHNEKIKHELLVLEKLNYQADLKDIVTGLGRGQFYGYLESKIKEMISIHPRVIFCQMCQQEKYNLTSYTQCSSCYRYICSECYSVGVDSCPLCNSKLIELPIRCSNCKSEIYYLGRPCLHCDFSGEWQES